MLEFDLAVASRLIEPFSGASAADLFVERRREFSFRLRNGETRDVRLIDDGGLAVRVTAAGKTTLVATDRTDEAAVREAVRQLARRLGRGAYPKAAPSPRTSPEKEAGEAPAALDRLRRRIAGLFGRAVPARGHDIAVRAIDIERVVVPARRPPVSSLRRLLSLHGSLQVDSRAGIEERPFAAHLPDGGEATLEEIRLLARQAARSSERPVPVPRGTADVLLEAGAAAYFFHEVLAHPLELDATGSVLHTLVGARLAPREVEVVDDPSRLDLFGGYTHDDEGVPSRPVKLLDAGRLGQPLRAVGQSTAMQPPSGHGRRPGPLAAPAPRSANIVVGGGGASEEEMLRRLRDGLLVGPIEGGSVDPAAGVFRLRFARARLVRRGRLTQEVGAGELSGGIVRSLGAIDPLLGARPSPCRSLGWCGRDGNVVPVGGEAPLLIVRGLEVRPR